MKTRDLNRLEDLGIVRPEVDDAVDASSSGPMAMREITSASQSSSSSITHGTSNGISWIQAARSSGGLKTRKGVGRSRDGATVVEWEVSEYTDSDPGNGGTRGKRKLGDVHVNVNDDEDAEME
jgi:hypothetical protein